MTGNGQVNSHAWFLCSPFVIMFLFANIARTYNDVYLSTIQYGDMRNAHTMAQATAAEAGSTVDASSAKVRMTGCDAPRRVQ